MNISIKRIIIFVLLFFLFLILCRSKCNISYTKENGLYFDIEFNNMIDNKKQNR